VHWLWPRQHCPIAELTCRPCHLALPATPHSPARSFGPCTGITRLQRWERAASLGLNPPPEVPQLVQRYGADSSFNKDLFSNGKV